ELLRRGEPEHAERAAEEAVRQAVERFAEENETARAKTVLAIVKMELGAHRAAREILEPLRLPPGSKEKLVAHPELAPALSHTGESGEAKRMAESNVVERKKAFGLDGVAYADGLDALAEVLLLRGELEVALDRIGEAVGIYFANKHSGIAQAVAIEAEILATS